MKPISGRTRLLLKIAVSAALLAFLLSKISIPQLADLFRGLDAGLIAATVAVFLLSNVIGGYQWHVLLKSSGVRLPFHRTIRFYFVGLFFNNFLPASIGGDAIKVYDLSRIGSSVYQVVAVTMLDRIIGIFSLCLLATGAALALMNDSSAGALWPYLLVFIACMTPVVGLYFFKPLSRVVRWVVRALLPPSWEKGGSAILDHLSAFRAKKPLIVSLMLLSVAIQAMRVVTHILAARALGLAIEPVAAGLFFVFVPILSLAMIPPITINGLGIREGLGILLFARAGIGQTDAFAIEFLTYAVSVVVSLLGLVCFVGRRGERVGAKADQTVS